MLRMAALKQIPLLSAGVVPVLRDSSNLYLLLRVFRYWDFPKGMVEEGEDPWAAACRELTEETGLARVEFPWGKDFLETEPYSRGKVARYYLGEVFDPHVSLLPNPLSGLTEHDEYRWVTYQQAIPLLVPRVRLVLDWAEGKIRSASAYDRDHTQIS